MSPTSIPVAEIGSNAMNSIVPLVENRMDSELPIEAQSERISTDGFTHIEGPHGTVTSEQLTAHLDSFLLDGDKAYIASVEELAVVFIETDDLPAVASTLQAHEYTPLGHREYDERGRGYLVVLAPSFEDAGTERSQQRTDTLSKAWDVYR